jgi:hypothetical protein
MAVENVASVAKESSKALQRLSAPNVFAPALVFVLLLGFFGFLYLFRSDWRDERIAQQRLYGAMINRMDDIHDHLIFLGAQKTERDRHVENSRSISHEE